MPAPISDAWSSLLAILDRFVSPDWTDPIHWLPLLFSGLVIAVLLVTAGRWSSMAAINRSRVPRPLTAGAPPAGVHLPGPSPWPFFLPIGLAVVLFSIVIHPAGEPVNAPLALIGLVVTLAVLGGWIRDAMLDWQRVEGTAPHAQAAAADGAPGALPARTSAFAALQSGSWVLPRGTASVVATTAGAAQVAAAAGNAELAELTAAGHAVHAPAPSPWPFFLPIGAFFVLFGLVMNPALLFGGLAMALIAIAGWFRDAGREFRQVDAGLVAEPASRDPERAFPKRLVAVYAVIAVASVAVGAAPSIIASVNSGPAAAQPGTAAGGAVAGGAAGQAPSSQLHVTAEGIKFLESTLTAPAGQPLTIVFENKDPVPHNIAIFDSSQMTKSYFHGTVITGPGTVTYTVPALQPGTYYFHCDVHPTMNGTLVVK
jgi:plastocyanin